MDEKPLYPHHCTGCVFLGRYDGGYWRDQDLYGCQHLYWCQDLYWCPNEDDNHSTGGRSVLLRRYGEGEYYDGIVSWHRLGRGPVEELLTGLYSKAVTLAVMKGHVSKREAVERVYG